MQRVNKRHPPEAAMWLLSQLGCLGLVGGLAYCLLPDALSVGQPHMLFFGVTALGLVGTNAVVAHSLDRPPHRSQHRLAERVWRNGLEDLRDTG